MGQYIEAFLDPEVGKDIRSVPLIPPPQCQVVVDALERPDEMRDRSYGGTLGGYSSFGILISWNVTSKLLRTQRSGRKNVSRLKFCFPKTPGIVIGSETRQHAVEQDVIDHEAYDGSPQPRKKRRRDSTFSKDVDEENVCIVDEDGDPVLERDRILISEPDSSRSCVGCKCAVAETPETYQYCITLKHSLATDLGKVGEQIWMGALLLCDYILDNQGKFTHQYVLDLGAGTGLTSIVAALFADHVYCTDVGENVLNLAKCNTEKLHNLPAELKQSSSRLTVRELDWFSPQFDGKKKDCFSFTPSEVTGLQNTSLLLAADVIYDKEITDAFFRTVKQLMKPLPQKTLIISLEKRLVFTLKDLDIASPGYEHFRQCLRELKTETNPSYHVTQLDTDFQQYFVYKRTKQLELWKVCTEFKDS